MTLTGRSSASEEIWRAWCTFPKLSIPCHRLRCCVSSRLDQTQPSKGQFVRHSPQNLSRKAPGPSPSLVRNVSADLSVKRLAGILYSHGHNLDWANVNLLTPIIRRGISKFLLILVTTRTIFSGLKRAPRPICLHESILITNFFDFSISS